MKRKTTRELLIKDFSDLKSILKRNILVALKNVNKPITDCRLEIEIGYANLGHICICLLELEDEGLIKSIPPSDKKPELWFAL